MSKHLVFNVNTLGITLTSDNVILDKYETPFSLIGVSISATMPVEFAKSMFCYVTDNPLIPLIDSVLAVTYSTLPIKQINQPLSSYKNIFPSSFTIDFFPPIDPNSLEPIPGYEISKYTDVSMEYDKDLESDYLRYLYTHLIYSKSAISDAQNDNKLPDNRSLSDPPVGVRNISQFKTIINETISNALAAKLETYSIGVNGLGSPYILGNEIPYNPSPSLIIVKEILDKDPGRLQLPGEVIDTSTIAIGNILQLQSGYSLCKIPFFIGDILDITITIKNSQTNTYSETIPDRTYRASITLV